MSSSNMQSFPQPLTGFPRTHKQDWVGAQPGVGWYIRLSWALWVPTCSLCGHMARVSQLTPWWDDPSVHMIKAGPPLLGSVTPDLHLPVIMTPIPLLFAQWEWLPLRFPVWAGFMSNLAPMNTFCRDLQRTFLCNFKRTENRVVI